MRKHVEIQDGRKLDFKYPLKSACKGSFSDICWERTAEPSRFMERSDESLLIQKMKTTRKEVLLGF